MNLCLGLTIQTSFFRRHFSPKGYLVLGESLAPAVEEVIAKQLGL